MNEKKYPIGGYAPGNYMCTCTTCKEEFTGDKRAFQCEPCAEKTVLSPAPLSSIGKTAKEFFQDWSAKTINRSDCKTNELLSYHIFQCMEDFATARLSALSEGKTETKESDMVDFLHYVLNLEGGRSRAVSKSLCEDYYKQFKNKIA